MQRNTYSAALENVPVLNKNTLLLQMYKSLIYFTWQRYLENDQYQ